MTTTTLESIRALAAPLWTILFGVIVLLLDLGSRRTAATRRVLPAVSIVGLIAAGIIALTTPDNIGARYFGGGMIVDGVGALFCVVLAVVGALAIGMAPGYLEEKRINSGEFYALVLFSTSGAMLMALSQDLVNVFVGLEVLSVALYILAGFARREERSEESAVKYFLLGAFASGFLLYGTALIYGSVGIAAQASGVGAGPAVGALSYTNFDTIRETLAATVGTSAPLASSPIFLAGVGLLIVGLGFKAAIVPFHSYAPDVYEGAPTPVTAFMSVAAKAGAFAAFLRLFDGLLSSPGVGPYRAVLWGLAVATMVVGNVLAVRQTNIKRMLAYSSVAHAGYILVGILAASSPLASTLARDAVRFYLFAYTFMNIGAFAVVVWLGRNGGEYLDIRDYAGLGKRNPLAAVTLSVFLLSLAGIPLTAGFLGKLYLFLSAIKAGEAALAVIGLVVSAIGVFYYLGVIVQMYFREPQHDFAAPREGGAKTVALLCALATIVFGVVPVPRIGPSVELKAAGAATAIGAVAAEGAGELTPPVEGRDPLPGTVVPSEAENPTLPVAPPTGEAVETPAENPTTETPAAGVSGEGAAVAPPSEGEAGATAPVAEPTAPETSPLPAATPAITTSPAAPAPEATPVPAPLATPIPR